MHTQGPWTAGRMSNGTMFVGTERKGDFGMIVADIRGDESDARLIAAAPELLEALEGLLAHLWDGRKRDVKKDYSLMVAEVAARDAIQKAGG